MSLAVAGLIGAAAGASAADAARIEGSDRVATALKVYELNRNVYTSKTAVLTRKDAYADALTGTPLAATLKAPVLTTASDDLDDRVLEALKRAGVTRVVAIGGEGALTPGVLAELKSAGIASERVGGVDRFDTARRIADLVMRERGVTSAPAFVATGDNFPDALAAGTAAATSGAVVMLSRGGGFDSATSDFLKSDKITKVTAVGGPAAAACKAIGMPATAVVGANRFETAIKLAQLVFPKPGVVVIASGETFADSLSGGPLAALLGGPLVLTPSTSMAASTKAYLEQNKPNAVVLGGPGAVAPEVVTGVTVATGGPSQPPAPAPAPPSTGGGGGTVTPPSGGGGGTTTPPIAEAPVITTQPASQTVSDGTDVTFSVVASNASSYQWESQNIHASSGWTPIQGQTSSSLTVRSMVGISGLQYRVKVTNAAGTTTSSVATLTVTIPPQAVSTMTLLGSPASVAVGQDAALSGSVAQGSGDAVPVGTVQIVEITDEGEVSVGGPLFLSVTGSGGFSTTVPTPAAGERAFKAVFTPTNSAAFEASTSLEVTLVVSE